MKSDPELQRDVRAELHWDRSIDARWIGVTAHNGVVMLTGRVGSYAELWGAGAAALRVEGVKDVVTKIGVELPAHHMRSDAAIADAAGRALAWNSLVPARSVEVTVEQGSVTLSGAVEWHYQSRAAEATLRTLVGIRGMLNLIEIQPKVVPRDVTRQINAALRRVAHRHARDIAVAVNGGTVTLSGTLDSWSERNVVQMAAWSAPGVRNVIDATILVQEISRRDGRTTRSKRRARHEKPKACSDAS